MARDVSTFQHVLRHLNDLPSLRTNDLVGPLFSRGEPEHEVHASIRRIVSNALEVVTKQHSIDHGAVRATRWRLIVQRCDLNGEPNELVAGELGLSRRQLYRERRAVQESMLDVVNREFAIHTAAARDIPSATHLGIEFAINTANAGSPQRAASMLESIVDSEVDRATRLRAMVELLEIYLQLGRTAEADHILQSARAICYSQPTNDPILEAEVLLAEALVYQAAGKIEQSIATQERLMFRLIPLPDPRNRRATELAVRSCLRLARHSVAVGNLSKSERYIAILKTLPIGGPANRVRMLLLMGEQHALLGNCESSQDLHHEALDLARNAHLSHETLLALLELAWLELWRSNFARATEFAQRALGLSKLLGSSVGELRAALVSAVIDVESGNLDRALSAFRKLRARDGDLAVIPCYSVPARTVITIDRAWALSRSNAARDALNVLDELSPTLEHAPRRLVGIIERIRAQAYLKMDLKQEAADESDRAIDMLEGCHLYHLGHAALTFAEATGSEKHRKRGKDIFEQYAS